MRICAIWCLWTLPASLALAMIVGVSVAISGGALPQLPEASVLVAAAGLVLPVQPLFWLVLAGWVALVRVAPALDSSWYTLLPGFLVWFVSINTAITLLFYQGELGLIGLTGFATFGALLLVPRAIHARLRPGAFHPRAAA